MFFKLHLINFTNIESISIAKLTKVTFSSTQFFKYSKNFSSFNSKL